MNHKLFNYVRGIASLASCGTSFRRSVREAGDLAQRRANASGISLDEAMDLNFFEIRTGQIGYTLLASCLLMLIVYLAAFHAVPEWVLCILAMIPGSTVLLALWLDSRWRAKWLE